MLTFAFTLCFFISCNNETEELLKQGCETTNKKMPMDVGHGLIVTSCMFLDGNVIYRCVFDEDIYDIGDFKDNKESIKESSKEYLKNAGDNVSYIINLLKKIGGNIIYIYEGNISKSEIKITIAADEL